MGCTLCKLHKTCKSVCIPAKSFGEKPDIMVVLEAPGKEDDDNATVANGRVAQTLVQVLRELNLLERVVLTNAVKCTSPVGNSPSLDILRRCRVHLDAELERYKPSFVILCGASAVKSFTGRAGTRLSEIRGRKNWVCPISGAAVLATYHPAAALAVPQRWYDIVDDLERVTSREFFDPQVVNVTHGRVTKLPKTLAFDLETMGLDAWDPARKIICVAWSSKKDKARVTTDVDGFVEELKKDPTRKLIGHNIKFELRWLHTKYGYEHQGPVFDTMIALHLLQEDAPSKSLKWAAHQYTGLGNYDSAAAEFLKFNGPHWEVEGDYVTRTHVNGDQKSIALVDFMEYCGWDAGATWEIYEKFTADLKKDGLTQLMMAEMQILQAVHRMECNGMEVDPSIAKRLRGTYLRKKSTLKRAVMRKIEAITALPDGFSLDSPLKLGSVLFGTLGLPVISRTKMGNPQVNEAVLMELSTHPTWGKTIAKILEYRKCGKIISTYLDNMLERRDEDNLIHANYKIHGTRTGRLSCTEPNLQNIPRDANAPIKKVFIGGQGRSFIQADYSQMELRVGALLSQDRRMLSTIRGGEDIHSLTAALLFGTNFTKEQRAVAKTINFGIFYGAGPKKVSATGGMTIKEAGALIRNWFSAYPGVKDWIAEQHQLLMDQGYVSDLFGRKRRLPLEVAADRQEYASLMRKAANMPVQGTAAQITKLAVAYLTDMRFRAPFNVVGSVHDSILCTTSVRFEDRAVVTIQKVMEDAQTLCWHYGFKDIVIDVPTPVDIDVGESWAR
jgi:DNA polymerase-1